MMMFVIFKTIFQEEMDSLGGGHCNIYMTGIRLKQIFGLW